MVSTSGVLLYKEPNHTIGPLVGMGGARCAPLRLSGTLVHATVQARVRADARESACVRASPNIVPKMVSDKCFGNTSTIGINKLCPAWQMAVRFAHRPSSIQTIGPPVGLGGALCAPLRLSGTLMHATFG